jgi:glycine/serine hydroxymethyltransferase
MKAIGEMIASIIHEPESEEVKAKVRNGVADITSRFPMYINRLKATQNESISAS